MTSDYILFGILCVLLLVLFSSIHVYNSFVLKKAHTRWILCISYTVDIIATVISETVKKASKSLYRPTLKAIKKLPGVGAKYQDFKYAKEWNVDDLTKAERKLSGHCEECGLQIDDEPFGHHHRCTKVRLWG